MLGFIPTRPLDVKRPLFLKKITHIIVFVNIPKRGDNPCSIKTPLGG
jgi:hypothetical protein